MEPEIQNLAALIRQTFEKDAWHGPSVKESLADIKDSDAFKRLPDTHSIIELVAHMTAWRIYVCRKLRGDEEYKVTGELNFPRVENWAVALKQLEESQEQLLAELEKFPEKKLQEQVPGRANPLSYYTLLHAIIHHDVYHTGQIMLVKKAGR